MAHERAVAFEVIVEIVKDLMSASRHWGAVTDATRQCLWFCVKVGKF